MALSIEIKVVPSSGKQKLFLDKNGSLKCFLKSVPEKGAANKELIKYLSKELRLPQNDIEIMQGLTERKKRLKIHTNISYEQFLTALQIDTQMSL